MEKRLAGEKAANFVEDGTIVGLGTGNTVYHTIMKLGERVKGGLFLGVADKVIVAEGDKISVNCK